MSSKFEFVVDFDAMDQGSIGDYNEFFREEFDSEDLDVNPKTATDEKPGSDGKVVMLAARINSSFSRESEFFLVLCDFPNFFVDIKNQ